MPFTLAPGRVESLSWSPDGRSLAMLVAEPGAEISDVFGSGRVGGPSELPDWRPEVSSGDVVVGVASGCRPSAAIPAGSRRQ